MAILSAVRSSSLVFKVKVNPSARTRESLSSSNIGCLGFVTVNFARCRGERKYTAFIQSFQNRTPFKDLPRKTRRRLRFWDDKVLDFLEERFKAMGVKRIALLPADDPLIDYLPKGLREKFYQELPRSHGFSPPRKLRVRMVDYYEPTMPFSGPRVTDNTTSHCIYGASSRLIVVLCGMIFLKVRRGGVIPIGRKCSE